MVSLTHDLNIPIVQQPTIERERLLNQLQSAVHHKLSLVIAPPGYGKTTLVAQFARQTSHSIVWHLLEQRERDVLYLHEHCLAALSTVVLEMKNLQLRRGAAPSELALQLTDQLRQWVTREIIYVLDDIHHVIDSPNAELWLRTFLANIPSYCHVILVGRAFPTLPITEMIARREVLAIGQEQLRFTFDEVTQLIKQAEKRLTATEIQQIVSRLDGWPAGTILAIHPLPIELQVTLFNNKVGPESLFNSLAENTFHAQSSSLQDFLLASSTLSQMSPALCQEALQLPDSLNHLTLALKQNLFISKISGGLVYHSLFRNFLQHQLERQNQALFIQLHTRAGRWFEEHNRLDEAFDHYDVAQLHDDAARVADRAAQMYWAQGKVETVLHWRARLGLFAYKAPQLVKTCAMIHINHYEYERAREELEEAEKGFHAYGDEMGMIQVTLLRATIDNSCGEYHRAIEQAHPLTIVSSIPSNLYGLALSTLGTAYLHLGDLDKALQHLEAALPHWREAGDAYTLSQLLLTLELTYLRLGRFDDATTYLLEVVSIRRALGSAAGLVMALNNLGYHYHLLGQYQEAQLTFEEALDVAQKVPEKRAESYLLWSIGDLYRDRGVFSEANTFYQRSLHRAGKSEPPLQSSVLTSLSTLRRWEGRYDEAREFALEAANIAETYQLALEKLKAAVALQAIPNHEMDIEATLHELEGLAEGLFQRQAQTKFVQTLGICAHAALALSDAGAAHRYLKRALDSVKHSANLQPLVAEIVHSPQLKSHILQHTQRYHPLLKGIKDLEAVYLQTPSIEVSQQENNHMPTLSLRVWVLGQERFERDGKLVSASAWRAASARALFCYLLFNGAASREQIGLVFWPDSSAQQIRQKFHNALHRIRDALGTNVILFTDELYSVNPDLDLWCDAHEFESLVQHARLTSPTAPHTETLWRRAVDLYQGDLMASVDADWAVSYQEKLHEEYLEALIALGNCTRIRGNVSEAITLFKRALSVDAFREDVYRALFVCYAQVGEHTLIQRLLKELTHILHAELGICPSAETLTLVQMLLN